MVFEDLGLFERRLRTWNDSVDIWIFPRRN